MLLHMIVYEYSKCGYEREIKKKKCEIEIVFPHTQWGVGASMHACVGVRAQGKPDAMC